MGDRPMIKVRQHVDMLSILLKYVRYGILMQIGTHEAIRCQHKTIEKRKKTIIKHIGSKIIRKM